MTPLSAPPRRAFSTLLAALVALSPAAAPRLGAQEAASARFLEQTAAPAWELKDVDGKTVRLADFKGKVVILDFWATWCPPCREEIPGFVELQKQYGERGLVVVGVSLDQGGPAVVKPFMAKAKMNYPVVMGGPEIAQSYGGIRGIPTTFIIDRQGRIAGQHVGYVEKSVFEKAIQPLL